MQRFREVISRTKIKNESVRETYLIRYEESYIVTTPEMDGAHGLPKYANIIKTDLQQVIHCIATSCLDEKMNIFPKKVY